MHPMISMSLPFPSQTLDRPSPPPATRQQEGRLFIEHIFIYSQAVIRFHSLQTGATGDVPLRCTPTASSGSPARCWAEDPEWRCRPCCLTLPAGRWSKVCTNYSTYRTCNIKNCRYLDETGVDVVCVVSTCGECELDSAVVN